MSSPSNLNEFANAMDKETEIYKKLTICEALVKYLKNPHSNISFDEQGSFCMNLIQWMASPSLKISLKALDAGLAVLERMPLVLKPYVSSCFPALTERYADSKEQVRTKVHQVLMAFVDKEILSPQALHEKLCQYGYQHKNSMVRVESLKCLMNILVIHGAKSLQLSASTGTLLLLFGDPSETVREEAAAVLVEIYRQVGEKLRCNIAKSYAREVPAQRLAALFTKFDGVKDPSLKKFHCAGDSLSRPESVEDFADGVTTRRMIPVATSSAATSRVASMEDLSKKSVPDVRRPYGTLGRSRGLAARSALAHSGPAGAVDEATFRTAFLDVPNVQLFLASDLRDGIKTISNTIGNSDEDWEKRVDALKKVRSYTNAMSDHPEFLDIIKKLEIPIFESLKDLRSSVVREACITIAFLAEKLKSKFTYFAEFVFPSLVVLIQNSAKVMSTSAQVAVRFIVENTSSLRLISLTVTSMSSKSKDIRRALCEILCIILSTWPVSMLEKKHAEIRTALQKGVADADPEARQLARKAFCEYKSNFPERADELLRSLDVSYRRMLSEGSTESVNATPSSAGLNRGAGTTPRKPNVADKRPVFNRSNTAVDAQAVQRAQVRAQYAAMHRQKAGVGVSGRPPSASPLNSMTNSTLGMSSDENSTRSRPRAPRYSRSQPTSRSASPCAQFNYQTYQPRSILNRPTGIPGPRSCASSVETSRETSPTRLGAIPKARKRLVPINQACPTPPLSRPAMSQRMLQQSREAEHVLANAFTRNETDSPRSMSGEKSSDESETSSLCDRTSCGPTPPHIQDIRDVLENLSKSDWSYRKDGLFSLKYYLIDHSLGPEELKRVTDLLTRMFMDSQTKGYTLFLETLSVLLQRHWQQLDSWLYILLQKLFTKLGTDVLPTIEKNILNVLSLIRESFPHMTLVKETFRFIADPLQVHHTKVRMHILKHLSQLATDGQTKSSKYHMETPLKDNTAAVISKIVKWSEIPELKETAVKCIADLFYMNTLLISSILPKLSYEDQLVVDNAVKTFLKSHGSSPISKDHDDVTKSLQITSQEIQTYKFDGLSQDSGICPLSPTSPSYGKYNIEERFANASISKPHVKNNIHSDPPSTEDSQKSESSLRSSSDTWGKILDTLRPDSDNNLEERKNAMMQLIDLVKYADTEVLGTHIVKIIKRLVSILTSLEDHAATASELENAFICCAFTCLSKLSKKSALQPHFANFHELLALKTFSIIQNPDYKRSVVLSAEECLRTMAQTFPVNPLLAILLNFVFEKSAPPAYLAVKTIQEVVKNHTKAEFDPYFNETLTLLLMAFDSDFSAVRKAVVFCLVELHSIYGESEMAPYMKKLDSSKKKLVDVYIKKSQKESK